MSLSTLLIILRVQWRIIAAITLTILVLTLMVSLAIPKVYEATTDLIVDPKNQDPISGQFAPTRLGTTYIGTQVDIILSSNVASKVIAQQKLADNAVIAKILGTGNEKPTEAELASFLKKGLSAIPDKDSSLITISFKSRSPELSALLANAFAMAYIQANLELRTEPAKQINQWYDQQLASLRKNLVEKQEALSAYQETHGILIDNNRVDLETAKLTELSNMLTAVQGERLNSQTRSNQIADTQTAALPAQALDNPQVQKLSADLGQARAHLRELSSQVGENHPQYIQALHDVESLNQQLSNALQLVSGNLRSSVELSKNREEQLQMEVDLQKNRVLQLNRNRNQLNLMTEEVDNAQAAFNSALARSSQTRMESLISQSDIAVLNKANVPSKSSSPKILMNLIMAAIVGLLFGIAAALGIELYDSRIRSAEDFEEGFGLSVLAFIPSDRVAHNTPALSLMKGTGA